MKTKLVPENTSQAGFSLMELLVVLAIVMILSGISIFYLAGHQKLYKVDDQALQLVDILQEARQRALAQKDPLRVEINLSTNMVSLINENTATLGVADDVVVKRFVLAATSLVTVSTRPAQITVNPPEPMPVPAAVFKNSVYTPSAGQNVCTIRFIANGSATDGGTNATASDAVPTGVSLFVWSPKKNTPAESDQARAITVLAATGAIRMWEYDSTLTGTNKWKDSRKSTTGSGS